MLNQKYTNFNALNEKLISMGMSFRDDIQINHMEVNSPLPSPELKADFFLRSSFSEAFQEHIKYLLNFESSLYFKVTLDGGNVHMIRTPSSVSDVIAYLASTFLYVRSFKELEVHDDFKQCIISYNGKSIKIEPLFDIDFVKVDEKRSKKISNVFKGLTTVSSVEKIEKKFKSVPLLKDNFRQFNIFNTIPEGYGIIIHGGSPYMDSVNNYAAILKDIINDNLINEKISLAQSQELLSEYIDAGSWHILAKNEKKFSVTPFHVQIEDSSGRKVLLCKNLPDAITAIEYYVDTYKGDLYINNSSSRDTIFNLQDEDGLFKIFVRPIMSIFNGLAKQYMEDDLSICPEFEETMEIKKSFLLAKPKDKELPIPFSKTIAGLKWNLLMCRFRGVSFSTYDYSHHTAEVFNSSIMKSKHGGYALCRYDYEERDNLGQLSNAQLDEISKAIGITIGYGDEYEKEKSNFKNSEAYKYYYIWANDHINEWIKNIAMESEAANQALSLLEDD